MFIMFPPVSLIISLRLYLVMQVATIFLVALVASVAAHADTVRISQPTAVVIQTSEASTKLTPVSYPIANFSTPGLATIMIDETKPVLQEIMGFGGAFTDSVAHIFSQLNATLQEEFLEAMWGKSGQQYNLARLTIGSTDFSTSIYNYNDNVDDFQMGNFSIAHDQDQIIPMIKRAMAKNGDLSFLSTSWSPPGWMKDKWFADKGAQQNRVVLLLCIILLILVVYFTVECC